MSGLPTICADVTDINIGNGILKKTLPLRLLREFFKLLMNFQLAVIQNLTTIVELMIGAQPIHAAWNQMKLVLLLKKNVNHRCPTPLVLLGAVTDMTAQKASGALQKLTVCHVWKTLMML